MKILTLDARMLRHHRVLRQLGGGSIGVVYEAEDTICSWLLIRKNVRFVWLQSGQNLASARSNQIAYRDRSGLASTVPKLCQNLAWGALGLQLSEKQIPQVVVFIRKG